MTDTNELRRRIFQSDIAEHLDKDIGAALDELDALRAEVAKLTAERDALRELVAAVQFELDNTLSYQSCGCSLVIIKAMKGTNHAPST